MSTTFEPTLSHRAPYQSALAPSMADSLPSINFGFEELRDRMAKFTVKFDSFIEAGRKRVLQERNDFRSNVAEMKEEENNTIKRIELLQQQIKNHSQILAREEAETAEITSQINDLTLQRNAHLSTKSSLETTIKSTQEAISTKTAAQTAYSTALTTQSRHDIPELDFWVQTLGLRISGAGMDDRILFTFNMLDEGDFKREAWFELSTEKRDYEIRKFSPKVERARVDALVDMLNESRALGPLMKGMRELFVEWFAENK